MKQTRANSNTGRATGTTSYPEGAARLRISSATLFQGGTEITIVHHDEDYRLRITRNGKLILTK